MRNRLVFGVGKREMCALATESLGKLRRFTAKFQNRTLPGHAQHLHILPGDPVAQAGTDGLHSGLLGGKAGRQTFSGIDLAHAVTDLRRGEDTLEESVAKTLHGGLYPPHFGDVNPSPYYHLGP